MRPDWPWEERQPQMIVSQCLRTKMVNTMDVTGVGVCGGWRPYVNLQVGSKRA